MKIEFEGRTWQLEMDEITMTQADVIGGYTGLSLMAWYKSLLDTDALAWNKSARCLYWLMREQNGESVLLEQGLNFAPLKLFAAFTDAMGEDDAAEAEPDPTKPAGEPAAGSPDLSLAESPRG